MKKFILIFTIIGILFGYRAEAQTSFNYTESSGANLPLTACNPVSVSYTITSTGTTTDFINRVQIHLPVGIICNSLVSSTPTVIINSSAPSDPIFIITSGNQTQVILTISIQSCVLAAQANGNTQVDVIDNSGNTFLNITNSTNTNYSAPMVNQLPIVVNNQTFNNHTYNIATGDMGELVFEFINNGTSPVANMTIDLSDLAFITLTDNNNIAYSYWIDTNPAPYGYCNPNQTPPLSPPSNYTPISLSEALTKVLTLPINVSNVSPSNTKTVHICFRAICPPNTPNIVENINFRTCTGGACFNHTINSNINVIPVVSAGMTMDMNTVLNNNLIADVTQSNGTLLYTLNSTTDPLLSNHGFGDCDPSGGTTTLAFQYTNNSPVLSNSQNPAGYSKMTDIKIYFKSTDDLGAIKSIKVNGFQIFNLGVDIYGIITRCTLSQNDFNNNAYYNNIFSGPNAITYDVTSRISTYLIDFGKMATTFAGNIPFGTTYPSYNSTLMDLDGDGSIDDLASGGSFDITVDFEFNQNCPFKNQDGTLSDPYSLTSQYGRYLTIQTSSKFNTQCGELTGSNQNNFSFDPLPPYGSSSTFLYGSASNTPSTIGFSPLGDISNNSPFTLNICPGIGQNWKNEDFMFNCPNGYHNIHIPLPYGYHLDLTSTNALNIITPVGSTRPHDGTILITCNLMNGQTTTLVGYVTETPELESNPNCTPGYIDINLDYTASPEHFGLLPTAPVVQLGVLYTGEINCISLPLIWNCDPSATSCQSPVPDEFNYFLEYVCCNGPNGRYLNGTPNSFPPDLSGHCGDKLAQASITTVHHSCAPCPGTVFQTFPNQTLNSFTFERRTYGWEYSNNQFGTYIPLGYDCSSLNTSGAQLTPSSPGFGLINLAAAYPNDKVETMIEGEFKGNATSFSDMFLRLRYDNFATGTVANNLVFRLDPNIASTITVVDNSGALTIPTVTITPALFQTPNNLNNSDQQYMQFSFAPAITNMPYQGTNGSGYHFIADIHLIVESAHQPNPQTVYGGTFFAHGVHHLDALRGEFMGIDNNGENRSCDDWSAEFTILQPTVKTTAYSTQNSLTIPSNCSEFDYSFIFAVKPARYFYGQPDFPFEFRPYATLNDYLAITIPDNYSLSVSDPVQFVMSIDDFSSSPATNNFSSNAAHIYTTTYHTIPPGSNGYTLSGTNNQTINFNGLFGGTSCWPLLDCKEESDAILGYPSIYIKLHLQPHCNALPLDQFIINGSYTENYQNQDANDRLFENTNTIVDITTLPVDASINTFPISHVSPQFTFTANTTASNQIGTQVTSPTNSYCITGNQPAANAFLYLPNTVYNNYFSNLTLTLNGSACNEANGGVEQPPQVIPYDTILQGFSFNGTSPSLDGLQNTCFCFYLTGEITNVPNCALPVNSDGTTFSLNLPVEYKYSCTGAMPNCPNYDNPDIVTFTFNLDPAYVPAPTITASASATNVCPSTSVTLSAGSNVSGTTNYSWSDGINTISTAQTFTVSPTATTTYTVTGVNAVSSCSNTATVTVTVNPTVVVNSPTICSGLSATLTATIANSTGNETYTWSSGATSTGVNTASASPTVTTTYTVTGNNGTCSNTALSTIVVNPTPIISINSPSICLGQTASLVANGATSYFWPAGVSLINFNTVEAITSATTAYTVTGTNSFGCSNTATATVTVNPIPIVSANATPTSICTGAATTIALSSNILGTSFNWTVVQTGVSGASTGSGSSIGQTLTTGNTAGTAVYTITPSANNCVGTAATVTVTVNPLPTVSVNATAISICTGTSVTLTGGGASTYVWDNGVQNGVPFVPQPNMTYEVTGTDINQCTNTASVSIAVNNCCTNGASNVVIGSTGLTMIPPNNTDYLDLASELMLGGANLPTNFAVYNASNELEIDYQVFAIGGVFTVDQNLTLRACDIVLGPGAQIVLTNGATLTLDESHLHGCSSDMWDGIKINSPNEKAVIKHNVIEDAITAVSSSYGGQYIIGSNIFNKNYVGLSVSYCNGAMDMSQCFVDGNIFTCRDFTGIWNASTIPIITMPYTNIWWQTNGLTPGGVLPTTANLPSHLANFAVGIRSYAGIMVTKVNAAAPLLIGGQNFSAEYNAFDYLDYGVVIGKSDVKVQYNVFENIDNVNNASQLEGTAIYSNESINNNSALSVGGANTNDFNIFDHCKYGIQTNECNTFVNNNYFNTINQTSIFIENSNGMLNKITNNKMHDVVEGIYCLNIAGGNTNVISNNVNVRQPVFTALTSYFGIYLANISSVPLPTIADIHDDTIANGRYGITMMMLEGNTTQIHDNIIKLDAESPYVANFNFFGIRSQNCAKAIIRNNTVDNITATLGYNQVPDVSLLLHLRGISIEDSYGSTVSENNINKMGQAIFATGHCDFSALQCNRMSNSYHGVHLTNAEIDDQVGNAATGNEWWNFPSASQHKIAGNIINLNATHWYFSGPGVLDCSGNNSGNNNCSVFPYYLFQIQTSGNSLNCAAPTTPLHSPIVVNYDNREYFFGKIVRGEKGYDTLSFEFKHRDSIYAFHEFYVNNAWLSIGGQDDIIYQAFFNYCANHNFKKFEDVNYYVKDSINADTVVAKVVNDNIVSSNTLDDNQHIVNDIYLKKLIREKDSVQTISRNYGYTTEDTANLYSIAYQYPLKGGGAVYQARVMLKVDLVDESLTRSHLFVSNNNQITYNENIFKLFPNPNIGAMQLTYQINVTDIGYVVITDIVGRQLNKYKLEKEKTLLNIDESELRDGIYFCQIYINEQEVYSDKIIIAK